MHNQVYGKRIPVEIPVQLCLRDFLREGDCAFDVGANVGALSVAMSRMVAAQGQVHAFEPNPEILESLRNNLKANKVTNVEVVPKAAWRETGRSVPFFCDPRPSSVASSLRQWDGFAGQIVVQTVTLDHYCEEHHLIPQVVKLDVEGAEFEALVGAKNLLARGKPVLVLEYFPKPTSINDSLEFLGSLGYVFFDVNLYCPVSREFYRNYGQSPSLVNVLAVPEGNSRPYHSVEFVDKQTIAVPTGQLRTTPINLSSPGRYVVAFDFDGPSDSVAAIRTRILDGDQLGYQQAKVFHLKTHSCSCMVFEIDQACEVSCELLAIERNQEHVEFRKVEISRIVLGANNSRFFQKPR